MGLKEEKIKYLNKQEKEIKDIVLSKNIDENKIDMLEDSFSFEFYGNTKEQIAQDKCIKTFNEILDNDNELLNYEITKINMLCEYFEKEANQNAFIADEYSSIINQYATIGSILASNFKRDNGIFPYEYLKSIEAVIENKSISR